MENLTVFDVALVPLIVVIVAVIIGMGLPKRFAPTVALVLGVVVGIVYVAPADPKEGVLVGLALGMAAIGLHSGTKNTIEPDEVKEKDKT